MAFCFVHAADLHIDSPLKGLAAKDEAVAERFAAASRRAFRALIERTIAEGAAFLVIAGDVFDGDWRDYSTGLFFSREIARLGRAGIATYVVRGNHDAESQITRQLDRAEGLHVFSSRKAETVDRPDLGVALHGRSFATAAEVDSFARGYPEARPGRFNIGVLHTSLDGRDGHDRYAPTSVPELATRGYDYWALGHVHAYEEVCRSPWIVYPGNLQGRHIRECGPRGAVLVRVGDDVQVSGVERLILDEARWSAPVVDIAPARDREAAISLVRAAVADELAAADGRPLALRITLTGTTLLHHALAADPAELSAAIENAALQSTDAAWIERVVLATRPVRAPSRPATDGLADASALIAEVIADPEGLRDRLMEALLPLEKRLPPTIMAELGGCEAVLEEARDLVLGRLAAAEG